MNTRDVINKYFECVNAGRWEEYLSLFDEHVVMDEQIMGHLEGIAAVREGIKPLQQARKFQNRPLEIVVDGNKGAAICQIDGISAAGTALSVKVANFYEVRGGRIVHFSNYHDTAPFQAAAPQ